ncbi:hypothetical protein MRX96_031956 [Rhipicephalus microplus]
MTGSKASPYSEDEAQLNGAYCPSDCEEVGPRLFFASLGLVYARTRVQMRGLPALPAERDEKSRLRAPLDSCIHPPRQQRRSLPPLSSSFYVVRQEERKRCIVAPILVTSRPAVVVQRRLARTPPDIRPQLG